jgi:hypothetical protein
MGASILIREAIAEGFSYINPLFGHYMNIEE